MAVLAAGGVEALVRSRNQVVRGLMLLGILAIISGETFRNADRILAVVPAEAIRQNSSVTDFLSKHADRERVLVQQDLLTDREAWEHRISKVHGYDPVPFTRAAILFDALAPGRSPGEEIVGLQPANPQRFRPELVELLGVKYAVVPANIPLPKTGWKKVAAGRLPRDVTLAGQTPEWLDYQIFEHENFLPRAFVLGETRVLEAGRSFSEQLAGLSSRREVLVHQDVLPAGTRQPFGPAAILEYTPNRVVVEADLEQPGYLVLSDIFAAGWSAKVDGTRAQVLPANVAFRAVPLPAGAHRVEFVYNPPGFILGAGLSLIGLLILLALMGRSFVDPDPL